jgi:hypothetical protein
MSTEPLYGSVHGSFFSFSGISVTSSVERPSACARGCARAHAALGCGALGEVLQRRVALPFAARFPDTAALLRAAPRHAVGALRRDFFTGAST